MKTTFEELKAELLLKAKSRNACKSGYTQAEKCETEKELLQVIADNFHWVWQTKTMTIEDLNKFGSDLLQSAGIFVNYEKNIKSDLNKLILVGTTSPTIVTYGSSSPTIVTYDSSSPRIVTNNSSSPTIVTYGSSSPRIVTYDSSSPTITGIRNCIIDENLSMIIDLDNSVIIKSDSWAVK